MTAINESSIPLMVPSAKSNQNTSSGPSVRKGISPRTVEITVRIIALILKSNAVIYREVAHPPLCPKYVQIRYIPALIVSAHSIIRAANPPWSKVKLEKAKIKKGPMKETGIVRMTANGSRIDSKAAHSMTNNETIIMPISHQ